jgi:hypothetical protein
MRKQTGSRNRGWLPTIGNRLSVAAGVALVAGMMAGTAWGNPIVSQGSGNWGTAGTWNGGVPQSGDDVYIQSGHTITFTGTAAIPINSLTITGTLTHAANTTSEANKINLNISGDLTIAAGGTINVDAMGYNAGQGPGAGNNGNRPGGGHGGMGGVRVAGNTPATTYGSITNPVNLGSGGGDSKGAGAVILAVTGVATINGTISAIGQTSGQEGGGAGGSIYLTAGSIAGTGTINAKGGNNNNGSKDGGTGGGGRIALIASSTISAGLLANVTAYGGTTQGAAAGGAGTIYTKTGSQTYGDLKVDNGGVAARGEAFTLVKDSTYQFDSVTTTGQGILALGNGAVLNVTGCTFTMGNRLIVTGTGQLGWTGSYTLGFTVSQQGQGTWVIPGDLVVGSGGLLQHETGIANWLKLDLANHNLTIDTGGSINVQGMGYAFGTTPAGTSTAGSRYGGVHGGQGGWGDSGNNTPTTPTYGSITNPITPGSGGGQGQAGGGVVILNAVGDLTINTSILAGGNQGAGSGGAGGSVNISAAKLLGSGYISVKGGDGGASNGGGGGGGGRIAVVLSGALAPGSFDLRANGGARPSTSMARGGAGTIYLVGTDSPLDGAGNKVGLLRISNNQTASESVSTLISSAMVDTTVGDVEVLGTANFSIDAARTLAVYGNWSNAVSGLTLGGAGVVEFKGTATRTISGSTVFPKFKCVESDKTLQFTAGTTQTVKNNLTLGGTSGHLLVLQSTTAGSRWNFAVDPACVRVNMTYLDVKDSAAHVTGGSPVTVKQSTDGGNNDDYWVFSNPADIVWTGASGTGWNTPGNWNPARLPLAEDLSITIPDTANDPILDVVTTYSYNNGLTIATGASLDLNTNSLTVGGAFTNNGTLIARSSETLTVNGTVDFTGATFTPATSKLILNAAAAGTQTFKPDGKIFYRIEVPNAITLNVSGGGFTVAQFYCRAANAQLNFNAGSTYAVTDLLDLRGTAGNLVKLRSSSSPTKWNLNLSGLQVVRYVDVQDSDASAGGGRTIYAIDSTDSAGSSTVNWDFGNGKFWTGGGADSLWSTTANWSGNTVPGVSSYVYIDGSAPRRPQITAGTEIAALTVLGISGAETLTVDLNSSSWLKVNGDMYIGANGTITHSQSTTLRVGLDVGSMMIAAGGSVNVQGRGYAPAGNRSGGRHGGEGGWGNDGAPTGVNTPPYGSITNPITPGMGSQRNAGGGVVVIQGSGAVTVNAGGQINAAGAGGTQNGGGAGGSVNIKASQLLGTGSITVDGAAGAGTENGGGGGGGRIAVVLSGAAAPVSFPMSANGGSCPGYPGHANGGAGTIYLVGTDSPGGMGLLRISNNQTASASVSTLISANPDMTDTSVGSVELLNQAKLVLHSTRKLSVYGSWNNTAGATAISGGTVELAGNGAATVSGDNTWSNLTIATAGKIVSFEAGKTQTVYGVPAFSNVTLQSTSAGNYWYLLKPGSGTQDVGQVSAQDSNATNGWAFRPSGGANLGHNVNWIFPPKGTVILLR